MSTSPIWSRLLRHGARVTAVGLLLAWPGVAFAEEPTIEEVQYAPTELPPDAARSRLLWTGLALTAGWYGASVGTSYLWEDAPNARDLRLPVVGPWLALGDVGCGSRESSCKNLTVVARTALAVISGVGQAGGLLALAEGLFMPTGSAQKAPQASRGTTHDAGRAGTSWTAVPVSLPNGAGIEVVGRF
jgi:hypothetical protein